MSDKNPAHEWLKEVSAQFGPSFGTLVVFVMLSGVVTMAAAIAVIVWLVLTEVWGGPFIVAGVLAFLAVTYRLLKRVSDE